MLILMFRVYAFDALLLVDIYVQSDVFYRTLSLGTLIFTSCALFIMDFDLNMDFDASYEVVAGLIIVEK